MKTGIQIIEEERVAHQTREGFDSARDDQYTKGELAEAASCYTQVETRYSSRAAHWPISWNFSWWKPTPGNRVKELAKAGALIAAEIDRLNRLAVELNQLKKL